MPLSPRRTQTRNWRSRTTRVLATIRCWPTATTPASHWPGCCAAAAPGATPWLITRLDALGARAGHQLVCSVGWDLGERERTASRLVPRQAWQAAVGHRGE